MRPTLTCVEGVGMHRHSARLTRFAGGALIVTAITPWLGGVALAGASKPAPPTGDDRSGVTAYSGNVTTCAQIGMSDATQIGGGTGSYTAGGWDIASDGTNLTVNAVAEGQQIDALVVKGGDGYNIYDASFFAANELPVGDIHAPLVGNPPKNVPTISHWFACTGPADENPPPVVVDPTATVTPTCDAATVDVSAGSDATTFVISQTGKADVQDAVAANAGDEVVVPWSGSDTVSVSVLDGEGTLASATRDSETCDVTPPTANPAVSFSNACTSGISVVLKNMDATAPVTFSVTHNGATRQVTVRADSMRRIQYAVAEDTTGTVTVTAPGLSKTTHSYAKNCTKVLGEKVVKTPKPQVQGEQAQLPFTGMPAGMATIIAILMLTVGAALSVVGRRRTAEESAS